MEKYILVLLLKNQKKDGVKDWDIIIIKNFMPQLKNMVGIILHMKFFLPDSQRNRLARKKKN